MLAWKDQIWKNTVVWTKVECLAVKQQEHQEETSYYSLQNKVYFWIISPEITNFKVNISHYDCDKH